MTDADKALVRSLYDQVERNAGNGAIGRAVGLITRYANDPAFKAHRSVLLTIKNMVAALPAVSESR